MSANLVCPSCRREIVIDPIGRVEAAMHVPARLIYNCPYCQIPFYVRDDAEDEARESD